MHPSRRAYLATVAGAVTGVAGCLGGGGGSGCDAESESPVESLPTPVLGDPEADVVVMAFEDFSCPHCATYQLEEFPALRDQYVSDGTIRYEHHDYPIPVDRRWSWAAASAARGVQDESDDETFFRYAHDLFAEQGSYSLDVVQRLADDLGVDGCDIREDADTETYRPVLETDRQRGSQLGVPGTPAIFVDGSLVQSYAAAAVSDAIERAL